MRCNISRVEMRIVMITGYYNYYVIASLSFLFLSLRQCANICLLSYFRNYNDREMLSFVYKNDFIIERVKMLTVPQHMSDYCRVLWKMLALI
jgi:hypothetical protein